MKSFTIKAQTHFLYKNKKKCLHFLLKISVNTEPKTYNMQSNLVLILYLYIITWMLHQIFKYSNKEIVLAG